MVLQFKIDPATGVYQPPVTVFNGGKRKTRKGRKGKKTKKSKNLSSQTLRLGHKRRIINH
jgi:hypothetical protein